MQGAPLEPDWTCPFCSLLCDGFALAGTTLQGTDCPRALAGLAAHPPGEVPLALIDGDTVPAEGALAEAAQRLASWQQPLFGGLGTDVAGGRALFRLAAATGAICDHADGDGLMHGLRALQDRGQFHTTLAEVRQRADLVVCVGTQAVPHYPEFFRRCGMDRTDTALRQLVFLGVAPPSEVPAQVPCETIAGSGDLMLDLQQLAALVAAIPCGEADAQLVSLASRLREARYAVLVWESATLPLHGALWVEMLNRIVATLNRSTRAASFGLGGSDGAYAMQQVFTWLSGLPLRTRAGPAGLEHEPLRFAAARLLEDHAVDGLLWVWSFAPDRLPAANDLPRIVLGPPGMGPRLREAGIARDCVFLPVATPGLHAPGHLFRTDGVVVPLVAKRDETLPAVAHVLTRMQAHLELPA
ncbi:formylmethanofuran dehydrogenase [Ramlibacter sp.]|uniref:formylmethanofuran dehydrogenase n=1 Tax=Ramlibacter sp. TaxID=1917967 RepID=UPI00260D85B9|nr:formylmethanofuran dehydrogenase [Ramlibacter sp.]MDB5955952.1 formylmethanofuran dehydrogenase [Ramlibacter sp.]